MHVPFINLSLQYAAIREEINSSIQKVIDDSAFAGGKYVETFENEFAEYCGCPYAAGVGNGTEALWLALLAIGVGPGDEVITVPNTFIATAEAISFSGATPVFVDVEEKTYTMNPDLLEEAITTRTRAIIPVHIFGQMADMDRIRDIAQNYDLYVIEDACQAHGAEYKGKRAGSLGDIGCFSFYPGKNLGAYGEAGALVTSSEDIISRVNRLRDHGQSQKYHHPIIGWNARMDGIQGAILSVKLKHLESWTSSRRNHALKYNELLSGIESITAPYEASSCRHVYHLYSILTGNPDELAEDLKQKDIHCGKHYPIPVHQQAAYKYLHKEAGSYPVSEICSSMQLSLPMFAELTDEQIQYVCEAIKDAVMQQQIA